MRKIKVNLPVQEIIPKGRGVFSFMVHGKHLNELVDLDKLYRRKNLALKVFKHKVVSFKKFRWGYQDRDSHKGKPGNLLKTCTTIQNLFAYEGLAPRVYDVVLLESPVRQYYAQVVDWLEGDFKKGDKDKFHEVRKKYGIRQNVDPNKKNWIDGKFVDFQSLYFSDEKVYRKRLVEMANSMTDWGSKTGISYESVEELGVEGQRSTLRRVEVLGVNGYDFRDKTVLDIGCSTGSFCRLACKGGASRTVGLDIGHNTIAAMEIANYLGDWNIDFYDFRFGKDNPEDYQRIKKLTGLSSFDVIFFLSVNTQIGYPATYMKKLCDKAIFVEGHSADHEATFRPMMEKDFNEVMYMGRMRNNARPALVGIK